MAEGEPKNIKEQTLSSPEFLAFRKSWEAEFKPEDGFTVWIDRGNLRVVDRYGQTVITFAPDESRLNEGIVEDWRTKPTTNKHTKLREGDISLPVKEPHTLVAAPTPATDPQEEPARANPTPEPTRKKPEQSTKPTPPEVAPTPEQIKFKFKAENSLGEETGGTVFASSKDEAVQKIKESGLFNTTVEEMGEDGPTKETAAEEKAEKIKRLKSKIAELQKTIRQNNAAIEQDDALIAVIDKELAQRKKDTSGSAPEQEKKLGDTVEGLSVSEKIGRCFVDFCRQSSSDEFRKEDLEKSIKRDIPDAKLQEIFRPTQFKDTFFLPERDYPSALYYLITVENKIYILPRPARRDGFDSMKGFTSTQGIDPTRITKLIPAEAKVNGKRWEIAKEGVIE